MHPVSNPPQICCGGFFMGLARLGGAKGGFAKKFHAQGKCRLFCRKTPPDISSLPPHSNMSQALFISGAPGGCGLDAGIFRRAEGVSAPARRLAALARRVSGFKPAPKPSNIPHLPLLPAFQAPHSGILGGGLAQKKPCGGLGARLSGIPGFLEAIFLAKFLRMGKISKL